MEGTTYLIAQVIYARRAQWHVSAKKWRFGVVTVGVQYLCGISQGRALREVVVEIHGT